MPFEWNIYTCFKRESWRNIRWCPLRSNRTNVVHDKRNIRNVQSGGGGTRTGIGNCCPNPKPTPLRKPVCIVKLSDKHHLLFIIFFFPSWGPQAGPHNVKNVRFYYPCGDIWSPLCSINKYTHTHTLIHTHTCTRTHTHVCFCEKWGLSIGVMVFILYKLYVLLP